MNTPIRAFNKVGIDRFRSFLNNAREGDTSPIPNDLLISGYVTDMRLPNVVIEMKEFQTKGEMVSYLHEKITEKGEIPFNHQGLWSWLAAFYFESICPVRNGKRKIQEEAKYILNVEHWGRYYRHLVAAPIRLYDELQDLAKIYLVGTPDKHGDLMEQLASRQEIATNHGLIEAATHLYWDDTKQKIKKGARNKSGPGILRRFTRDIVPQFQMTYDLNSMTGEEVLSLLPPEFDNWK